MTYRWNDRMKLIRLLVCLALASCAITSETDTARVLPLDDGIYPVAQRNRVEGNEPSNNGHVVELTESPVDRSVGAAEQIVLVISKPVLRFRDVGYHEFKFEENGECTQITLENTDAFREHTRTHVGERLAVVIGNKVVSSHKIRNSVETKNFTITFCTEGGGDHLYKHLKTVLPAPRQ